MGIYSQIPRHSLLFFCIHLLLNLVLLNKNSGFTIMETHSITIPIISLLPFLLMLLTIAVFPLFWNHFWEKNSNKLIIAIVLSIPIIIYLLFAGLEEKLIETIVFDYVPFIILLGSLFTITGGIYLSGDIEARPSINTLFLGIGAVLASLMGTTGAAMLLIRPVIQTNKQRKKGDSLSNEFSISPYSGRITSTK